jgi:hypothetical protein
MELEEFSNSCSWISTKALREAADIKFSIKTSYHRKSASEIPTPTKLPCVPSSNTTLSAAQTPKNQISWNTSLLENTSYQKSFNFDIFPQDKKYITQIQRLNEEIQILSEQLKEANELIKTLTVKLSECNSKHALHLQALQERHEQKLKRNQKELELILHSSSSFSHSEIQKVTTEFHQALEKQQNDFESHLNMLEKRYSEDLSLKEAEFAEKESLLRQNFMTVILNMKEKFIEDLQDVKTKYKEKLKLLSNVHRRMSGKASKMD